MWRINIMNKNRLFVAIMIASCMIYLGCSEWQKLKGSQNFQIACESSGGEYRVQNNQCKCPDEEEECNEGVSCVQSDNKIICAGRATGDYQCVSSGGVIENGRCRCNDNPLTGLCLPGVVCDTEKNAR